MELFPLCALTTASTFLGRLFTRVQSVSVENLCPFVLRSIHEVRRWCWTRGSVFVPGHTRGAWLGWGQDPSSTELKSLQSLFCPLGCSHDGKGPKVLAQCYTAVFNVLVCWMSRLCITGGKCVLICLPLVRFPDVLNKCPVMVRYKTDCVEKVAVVKENNNNFERPSEKITGQSGHLGNKQRWIKTFAHAKRKNWTSYILEVKKKTTKRF